VLPAPAAQSGAEQSERDGEPRRAEQPAAPSAGKRTFRFFRELLIVVVGALIVSALLRAFVAQMFTIPSMSMEETLQINDRVLVQKVTGFARGDVVVFADPGGWLSDQPAERNAMRQVLEFVGVLPATDKQYLIKRVIGMPGDKVSCCTPDGKLTINDRPLDEPYLAPSGAGQAVASMVEFTVVVPAGRIFVLGDNRAGSRDSRCHLSSETPGQPVGMGAFVPVTNVVGPALAVVAPLNRFSRFETPPSFASIPSPQGDPPAVPAIQPSGISC